MALKTYIGARYAPQFMGSWNKSSEYAALSVVYTNDRSFVSRKTVPANTDILDTEYWIQSSDWNAQMEQYNQNVEQYNTNVVQYNQNVEEYKTATDNFFNETIHAYNTKADMVADESIKLGYTLITCGETALGDGNGKYYKAVATTSANAVALDNGLFASPFNVQNISIVHNTLSTKTETVILLGDILSLTNFNNANGYVVDSAGTVELNRSISIWPLRDAVEVPNSLHDITAIFKNTSESDSINLKVQLRSGNFVSFDVPIGKQLYCHWTSPGLKSSDTNGYAYLTSNL